MSKFTIKENGIWENPTSHGHHFDKGIYEGILNLIIKEKINNIVDFGCGTGDYIKNLIKQGYNCAAYDGNPFTPKLTEGIGEIQDLSIVFDLGKKYDLVISFEVGEHIPKKYEDIYIENICKHSNNYLLLSWAIIGQSGSGHINCQNNEYIINKIKQKGFEYDHKSSIILRNNVTSAYWFKNTIMLFKKNG
jgi:hypothetical protein